MRVVNFDFFTNNKNIFIWDILPELVQFLRYIKQITDYNTFILFLGRDCYFLEKIYRKMYPNDNNFDYVFCSRKLMYNSKNFKKYINQYINKKPKTIWIDIMGTGDSHIYYFRKEKQVPIKLFMKTGKVTQRHFRIDKNNRRKVKNKEQLSYDSIQNFLPEDWQVYDKEGNLMIVYYLESLFRAPYKSIIDLNKNLKPIFSNEYDIADLNLDRLINEYSIIERDIYVDGINLRTNKHNLHSKETFYNGLVIFDIDNTITFENNIFMPRILDLCEVLKIKVILCSERQNIFTNNNRNSKYHLKNIIKYNNFEKLGYNIDVWFNIFGGTKLEKRIYKINQIRHAAYELNLKHSNVLFFDDDRKNVLKAQSKGINAFRVCDLVGLNFNALKTFKDTFVD